MLSLLLAALSKATFVFYIALIPLALYFFKSISPKRIFLIVIYLFVAVIIAKTLKNGLLTDSNKIREFAFFENPLFYTSSIISHFQAALNTIGCYIKWLFFPHSYSCYHGYNTISIFNWITLNSLITLFAIPLSIYYIVKLFSQKSIISFSILILLIGIMPFSNFKTPVVGIVAERFIYFSSLGYSILLVYLLSVIFKFNWNIGQFKITKTYLTPFLFTLVTVYSILIFERNTTWKDELTLFRNDVKNNDGSCNLHYLLANKLYTESFKTNNATLKESLINETVLHYKKALDLMIEGVKDYPKDFTTINNIGSIYVNILNDATLAQPYFKKAIELKPTNEVAQFNYAFCYEKRQLKDSAIVQYEKIIADSTNYTQVYIQARELYAEKKIYAKAIFCDKKAISLIGDNPKLLITLGNDYLMNKDTLLCIEPFEKAVTLDPHNQQLKNQIIQFLISIGEKERADQIIHIQ